MTLRFEFRPYRAALREPLRTARGLRTERDGVLIRFTDENGATSLGEIAPLAEWGSETLDDAVAFCAALPAEFDAGQMRAIPDALPCCQFAFETALAALTRPAAPSPLRNLPIAALLPAGAAALKALEAAAARGYATFKWKIGVGPAAEEIGLLAHLFDRLPRGGRLRLDANGGLDLPSAELWLKACEGRPVEFLEQPFPVGREEAIIRLAHEYTTRLALDESVARPADLLRWLEFGWPGIYVIKPSLAGSPARLARRLLEYEAECVFSSALETAVGARAALLFAAAQVADERALGFGTVACFADEALNLHAPAPTIATKWLARLETGPLWDHCPNLLRTA